MDIDRTTDSGKQTTDRHKRWFHMDPHSSGFNYRMYQTSWMYSRNLQTL